MDRDEILKLAQKENENYDEREAFIQMKGYNYGMIASSIMFTFLVILKVFRGDSIYDIRFMYINIKWRRKRSICFALYAGELQPS